jgi:hypothetical protein
MEEKMAYTRLAVATAIAAVLAAIGLAACGGSSDNSGSSADQAPITKAIQTVAVGSDVSACTTYATQKFVNQTNGDNGPGQPALQECEKDAQQGQGGVGDSVDVSDINVDGDSATATAKVTGNIFDGQTIKVSLVKVGGQWKLDVFNGFEDFNRDAMVNAFKGELTKQGANSAAADCVTSNLQKQSDQALEASFTQPNSNTLDQQVFGPCAHLFKGGQ